MFPFSSSSLFFFLLKNAHLTKETVLGFFREEERALLGMWQTFLKVQPSGKASSRTPWKMLMEVLRGLSLNSVSTHRHRRRHGDRAMGMGTRITTVAPCETFSDSHQRSQGRHHQSLPARSANEPGHGCLITSFHQSSKL